MHTETKKLKHVLNVINISAVKLSRNKNGKKNITLKNISGVINYIRTTDPVTHRHASWYHINVTCVQHGFHGRMISSR